MDCLSMGEKNDEGISANPSPQCSMPNHLNVDNHITDLHYSNEVSTTDLSNKTNISNDFALGNSRTDSKEIFGRFNDFISSKWLNQSKCHKQENGNFPSPKVILKQQSTIATLRENMNHRTVSSLTQLNKLVIVSYSDASKSQNAIDNFKKIDKTCVVIIYSSNKSVTSKKTKNQVQSSVASSQLNIDMIGTRNGDIVIEWEPKQDVDKLNIEIRHNEKGKIEVKVVKPTHKPRIMYGLDPSLEKSKLQNFMISQNGEIEAPGFEVKFIGTTKTATNCIISFVAESFNTLMEWKKTNVGWTGLNIHDYINMLSEFIIPNSSFLLNSTQDPSTYSSALDQSSIDIICFTNFHPHNFQYWNTFDSILLRDHNLLLFTLLQNKKFRSFFQRIVFENWDWYRLKTEVSSILKSYIDSGETKDDIQQIIIKIMSDILNMCEKWHVSNLNGKKQKIWWNSDLVTSRKHVRKVRRKFQSEKNDQQLRQKLKTEYKNELGAYRKKIATSKRKCFQQYLELQV